MSGGILGTELGVSKCTELMTRERGEAKKKGMYAAAAWGGTVLLGVAASPVLWIPAAAGAGYPDLEVVPVPREERDSFLGSRRTLSLTLSTAARGEGICRFRRRRRRSSANITFASAGRLWSWPNRWQRPWMASRSASVTRRLPGARRRAVSSEMTMSPSAMPSPAGSRLARQLLQVKAEHVGRPIVLAVVAVQRADLVVVRQHQTRRRPRAPQRPQRRADARRQPPARIGIEHSLRSPPDEHGHGHGQMTRL